MIRYSLLVICMLIISSIAFRDWFRALCLSIPLLAFLERPDMPREMFGIGGLNPFNILLGIVLLAWFVQHKKENQNLNPPPRKLLTLYLVVLGIATLRALIDYQGIILFTEQFTRHAQTPAGIFVQSVINTVKWIIPGFLIYSGANSEKRTRFAVYSILLTGALLSLQVVSKMLPALVGADDLATRALRVLDRDIGYHRVDVAAITAAVAWAFIAVLPMAKSKFERIAIFGGFTICSLAMILTGGRAGMLSWAACGMVLATLRWRKLLIALPVFAIIALMTIPGLQTRLLEGFSEDSHESSAQRLGLDTIDEKGRDRYAITSGRVVVWPLVIDKAMDAPIFGHGRYAMQRTGIASDIYHELGVSSFAHPHNAYLELFLDTGIVGAIICLSFIGFVLRRSMNIFTKSDHWQQQATGGMCMAFIIVHLVASLGSQSFYPKQGATLMCMAIGLFLANMYSSSTTPGSPKIKTSGR